VLVVCHGNIWRSPYGEALLRRELAAHEWRTVAVSSAGFIGPGRPSPKLAVQLAGLRGIDLTPHRSRVIMPADVDRADLILVMNLAQGRAVRALGRGDGPPIVILGDLDPEAIETREIPDPYGQTRELSERSYARIDRCISALVDVLVTASPALAHAGAES
jgi:protein-tyrosine phosphatase